jgi:hypothetical protein
MPAEDPSEVGVAGQENEICSCKVGTVSEKYDVRDLPKRIGRKWLAEDSNTSLRQLATEFNTTVLRKAIEASGHRPLNGEVENILRLLRDDAVSSDNRVATQRKLQKWGIDPDEITDDFVSYQTVNRHIKQCLDMERTEPETSEVLDRQKAAQRIQALQNRTELVTRKTLRRFQTDTEESFTELNVVVNMEIYCGECGVTKTLSEFLEGVSCNCD